MTTHTQQILERIKEDWKEAKIKDTFNKIHTIEEVADWWISNFSTLENAVREQAFEDGRKSAFNEALELSVEQMNKKNRRNG
jgi:hypothetical protein